MANSSLFTYDSKYLLDTYASGPKHHVGFIPVFSIPENSNDPLANETSEICSGEGSQFCRYDDANTCSDRGGWGGGCDGRRVTWFLCWVGMTSWWVGAHRWETLPELPSRATFLS